MSARLARRLALGLALAAAACGDDHGATDAAVAIDAGPDAAIDATPDAAPDAPTLTDFVIDQITHHTDATGAPAPYAQFGTLPDPDQANPAAYAPLFP